MGAVNYCIRVAVWPTPRSSWPAASRGVAPVAWLQFTRDGVAGDPQLRSPQFLHISVKTLQGVGGRARDTWGTQFCQVSITKRNTWGVTDNMRYAWGVCAIEHIRTQTNIWRFSSRYGLTTWIWLSFSSIYRSEAMRAVLRVCFSLLE